MRSITFIVLLLLSQISVAQTELNTLQYSIIGQYNSNRQLPNDTVSNRYLAEEKEEVFTQGGKKRIDTFLTILTSFGIDTNEFLTGYYLQDNSKWDINKLPKGLLPNLKIYKRYYTKVEEGEVSNVLYSFSKMIFLNNRQYCVVRIRTQFLGHHISSSYTYLLKLSGGQWEEICKVDAFATL